MYWCCRWYKEQQLKKKERLKSEELEKRERINKSRWIVAISWRCLRRLRLLLCLINIDIHCLFILAVLFRAMIFMIIFSDMSLKLVTLEHVLFDTSSMSWMLNIMIYKQYKAEKSVMRIIEKAQTYLLTLIYSWLMMSVSMLTLEILIQVTNCHLNQWLKIHQQHALHFLHQLSKLVLWQCRHKVIYIILKLEDLL